MDNSNKESKHISEILGNLNIQYKRGSFDIKKNQDLVIDMILNNMKIEGQEVKRTDLIKLINESNTSK